MKRYGSLYNKIYDIENLKLAHKMARKGKTWYKDVQMVDNDEDKYLLKLQEALINKTYKTSEYINFKIIDKGKEREISKLPYYPDRICQWAIMLQIEHIFLNHFIYDTYASIPNKGIHVALKRVKQAMSDTEETKYCLKFDVKKFFPSIDKEILKSLLRNKIKDNDLLWLLDEIIDSCKKGIPIGNYLSQYFANYYLSYLDHYCKEELKCKYYFRYMDDIVIFNESKEKLHILKHDIEMYLNNKLKLRLKENWQVFPTFVRGLDFVGYRFFKNFTLVRKNTIKNIKSKLKSIRKSGLKTSDLNSIMSYMGWLKYSNSHNFKKKYMFKVINKLKEELNYEKSTKHSIT